MSNTEVNHTRLGQGTIIGVNFTYKTFLVRFVIDEVEHDMWVSCSDCSEL